MFYYVLFYLLALARTSSAMLNGSTKSKYPCHVSGLRKMAFHLSQLCKILAWGFHRCPLSPLLSEAAVT